MSSTKHSSFINGEQKKKIDLLRIELGKELPCDMNTDLNLLRWVHGWRGDLEEAVPRLRTYIENRRVAGLDDPDLLSNVHDNKVLLKYAPYCSFSICEDMINPNDNTVLAVNRIGGMDLHRMTKVIPCGEFLKLYFTLCEVVFRRVLCREKETGRPSGLTVIYDFHDFNMWNYVNPQAPIHKIHKLCLAVLQDYFCDMLHAVYIVNAPTVVNVILEVVKKFMHPATQQKLIVVSSKETLLNHIHPSVVPVFYGGEKRFLSSHVLANKTPVDPDTCAIIPKALCEEDHFVPRHFETPMHVEHVKPKQTFLIEKRIHKKGAKLYWQFHVNAEVLFTVAYLQTDGKRTLLVPRWVVNTPKLPEEGYVVCDKAGDYILEFVNCGTSWFNLKLEYTLDVIDDN